MHDWDEIEDLFDEDGRGKGGGKKRNPGSKTSKAARRIAQENAEKNRVETAKQEIRKVLERKDLDQDLYMAWLNLSRKEKQPHLDEESLEVSFYRSGGAGGQNVNKVSSAVSIKHLPTQTIVRNSETRDQPKNRENAMVILYENLERHLRDWRVVKDEGEIDGKDLEDILGVENGL